MAKSDQHRMVFDIRGRRKRVVQVVYAFLAVLMGLSLLTVVGPVSIGDVFGGGGGGSPTASLDDQAAKIEAQLRKQPQNDALWLSLARNRFSAGSLSQSTTSSGQPTVTEDAAAQLNKGEDAWARYLKLDPQSPNVNVAQLAANASATLAQSSTSYGALYETLRNAVAAQNVVVAARPSVSSYSNLAVFSYLAGDFQAGDAAAAKAAAEIPAGQRKNLTKSLAAYRKQGKQIQTQQKIAAKAKQGQGKQQLENPLGGLAGGGLGGATPTP